MSKITLSNLRNVRHYSIILNTTPRTHYVEYITIPLDLLISKNANISICEHLGGFCLADDSTREGFYILSRLLTKTESRQK